MHAGIVHQNLHRAVLEQFLHRRPGRERIGQVEMHRGGSAAGGRDAADDGFRGGKIAMGMHIYEVACGAQTPTDGRSDTAAAAGHQSPSRRFCHGVNRSFALKITVARPLSSGREPDRSANS